MAGPNVVRSVTEVPGAPDLYADEFWFASSQVTATMTLLVAVPPQPGASGPPAARIVGRVRMPVPVAADLARIIGEQMPVPPPQPAKGTKH